MSAGTVTLLHGLRHFVHWRHPRLLITESGPGAPATVHEASCTASLDQFFVKHLLRMLSHW